MMRSLISFIVVLIVLHGEAYRILGIFPLNAKSHFAMFGRLMKGLADRGHQVDVVSHFPLKKPFPNYTDVISMAGTLPDLVNNVSIKSFEGVRRYCSESCRIATVHGNNICHLMNRSGFKDLIKNPPEDPPYDLVITEIFGANCYLAMGQHLKVPVVGVNSLTMLPWANDMIGNPDNSAYIPNTFSNFNGRMNFWQRMTNSFMTFQSKLDFNRASEIQTDEMKKYFGPHIPSIREVERNISLILVNSHYSLNGVRPFTTGVIEVGGLHINEKEAILSDDLQKWLDDSKDGFVYISFGSMIKIESLPEKTLLAIYTSLAKLSPVRVLMKIAKPEELPPGLPSNVRTYPWISQLGVLKHKNIRAFVTHGGLMGTQEAIYFGVPMIGVPFYGDQEQNIKLYSEMNTAVAIDRKKLTVENLDSAFNAVLRDPSYTKAAKRVSALFRDRPMSALDSAIFWIEYVVRNNGRILRSPAMDLTWWQTELWDVYGFVILAVILAVFFMIFIVKQILRVFHKVLHISSLKNKREPKKSK